MEEALEEAMTVGDIIKNLSNYNADMKVVVFARGANFPTLCVKNLTDFIEINAGWSSIDRDEDGDY